MPLIFPSNGKLWGRLATCGGLVTRPEPPVHRPPAPAFGPPSTARGLNPLNPPAAAIAAGREVLKRTAEYLNRGVSFAVETTLSSRNRVDLIRQAKSRGYEIHLLFIGLNSPEKCITRIRNRAAHGGHFIPDADVRRRYARSVANAALALRLADTAKFYDNSGDGHRLILVANAGVVVWQGEALPKWVKL
jgi:predicted ABC-type ATPase